jgi:hypothetical protein
VRDRHSFKLIKISGTVRAGPAGLRGVDDGERGGVCPTRTYAGPRGLETTRAGSELQERLWSRLHQGGRLLFRHVDGVQLRRTDTGATFAVRPGEPAAVLAGLPAR